MLNVVRKRLFTKPSRFISEKRFNDRLKEFLLGQQSEKKIIHRDNGLVTMNQGHYRKLPGGRYEIA